MVKGIVISVLTKSIFNFNVAFLFREGLYHIRDSDMSYNRADESIIANVKDLRIFSILLADKVDLSFIFQAFSFVFYPRNGQISIVHQAG